MEIMEINGKKLDREAIRNWLRAKKVTLWMDWLITEPDELERAVDWLVGSCSDLAATAA